MTAKKWNRLRRKRPDLFRDLPGWSSFTAEERASLKGWSAAGALAQLAQHWLGGGTDIALVRQKILRRSLVDSWDRALEKFRLDPRPSVPVNGQPLAIPDGRQRPVLERVV